MTETVSCSCLKVPSQRNHAPSSCDQIGSSDGGSRYLLVHARSPRNDINAALVHDHAFHGLLVHDAKGKRWKRTESEHNQKTYTYKV